MKSKYLLTGLVLLAAVLIVISAGCIGSQKTYVVGVDKALSPWEFVDTNGEPQGVVIDLLALIAKDQGVTFTYDVPADGLWEDALTSGEIDTEGTIVITPEREQKYAFVEMPFSATRYTVVARTGSDVTLDDVLAGKAKISLFGNSVYEQWAKTQFGDAYPKMLADGYIVLKKTADELSFSVLSYEVDAAIAGSTTMGTQLNQYLPLNFIGYVGEPKRIGFVFRKDDAELQNIIRTGLEHVTKTPAFDAIVESYNLQHQKAEYVVGVDEYNPPWTYLDENGTLVGYDIEQIEWIAEQNGFTVSYKPVGWSHNLNAIISGDIDMWASSMAITQDRMSYVAFSKPYYKSGVSVAVKPGSSLTMADLSSPETKIYAIYGSAPAAWLEEYLGSDVYNRKLKTEGMIILANDLQSLGKNLESGDFDFVVSDELQLKSYADKGELKILFVDEDAQSFGIAMSNGNLVLQEMINSGIADIESSGKKAELLKKYGL